MKAETKSIVSGLLIVLLISSLTIALFHLGQFAITKLTGIEVPRPKTFKELVLSENTILYTVNSTNTVCYIVESKTNGYVDIEIDCK